MSMAYGSPVPIAKDEAAKTSQCWINVYPNINPNEAMNVPSPSTG